MSWRYPSDCILGEKKVTFLTDILNALDVPQYIISNIYP